MPFRFVLVFVSAAALTFAQTEAPAPSGAAAKVTLPPASSAPAPADATAVQPSQPQTPAPAPATESAQTAPKPSPNSPPVTPPMPATSAKQAEKNGPPAHKPYVFGALDVVTIKIFNQPNLSGAFPISSDGFVSIPIVGDIKADGLTATELRGELTRRLKDCCINNPEGEVDVQLGANHSKFFFVYGGVGRPGQYPLDRDDMTVLEALSDVGGFHEFAKKKKIRILRGTTTLLFNYVDASRGRHMEKNYVIQNRDKIFVDE